MSCFFLVTHVSRFHKHVPRSCYPLHGRPGSRSLWYRCCVAFLGCRVWACPVWVPKQVPRRLPLELRPLHGVSFRRDALAEWTGEKCLNTMCISFCQPVFQPNGKRRVPFPLVLFQSWVSPPPPAPATTGCDVSKARVNLLGVKLSHCRLTFQFPILVILGMFAHY